MVPQWTIEKKRDGKRLSAEEIREFIAGFTDGTIPDYQMSALAMAVFFQGMDNDETASLTQAMMDSGDVLDLSSIARPTCDKHSTGGIGDKVSLILAPLAAACGIAVPMISGRGLGITGGTLDKLESIPGYRTDLSATEFEKVISQCGCSIIGQTANLTPADKKLYALRDVTGTVPSVPLISASIMSKKLAEGAQSLVLDVKWGSGAFMKTIDEARKLANSMIGIGASMNRKVSALLTNMNQPLGETAGNALEVIEAIALLRNKGPEDLKKITVELCAEMLLLSRLKSGKDQAVSEAQSKLESGEALAVFKQMIQLQGGSPHILDDISLFPQSDIHHEVLAASTGYVSRMDADLIGRAALVLGAGRRTVTDNIDHAAGISGIMKIGSPVSRGDPIMRLHANNKEQLKEAIEMAETACSICAETPDEFLLINDRITGEN